MSAIAQAQREHEKRMEKERARDEARERKKAERNAEKRRRSGKGDDDDGPQAKKKKRRAGGDGPDDDAGAHLRVDLRGDPGRGGRGRPLASRMFDVIGVLKGLRRGTRLFPQEIFNRTGVDVTDLELHAEIERKAEVRVGDDGGLFYEPPHRAGNPEELLAFLRGRPHGVRADDAESTYPEAKADLDTLMEQKKVCRIRNAQSRVWMVYGIPEASAEVEASEELRDLWHSIKRPTPEEMRTFLKEHNLPVMSPRNVGNVKTKGTGKAKKKKERKVQMRSNAHLAMSTFKTGIEHAQARRA